MYKLLAAEDEEYSRSFLCNHLKEKFNGILEIIEVSDGKDALDIIKKKGADILMTDIRMPFVSGVELVEYIKKHNLGIISVLISGYEEFEYAKRGIEAGIRQYFVKPFDFSVLDELIMDFLRELDAKHIKRPQFIGNESAEIEEFFLNLVYGDAESKEETEKSALSLHIPFPLNKTPCDIIELSLEGYDDFLGKKWGYTKDSLNTAIDNLVSGFIDSAYIYCIRKENGFFEYLIFRTNDEKINYDNIADRINNILKLPIKVLRKDSGFSDLYELIGSKNKEVNVKEKALITSSYISEKKYDEAKRIIKSVKMSGNDNALAYFKLLNYGGSFDVSEEDILSDIINNIQSGSNSKKDIMEKAVSYIKKNYNKNISREDAARVVFFSPAYFARNFKQYTGKTYNDYLLEVRMEKAKEMLKENKYKIYEIAEKVGYENTKYFFRVFKLYTGYTPKDYIQNVLGKKVEE